MTQARHGTHSFHAPCRPHLVICFSEANRKSMGFGHAVKSRIMPSESPHVHCRAGAETRSLGHSHLTARKTCLVPDYLPVEICPVSTDYSVRMLSTECMASQHIRPSQTHTHTHAHMHTTLRAGRPSLPRCMPLLRHCIVLGPGSGAMQKRKRKKSTLDATLGVL